jgi:hypothetical protein
MGSSNEATAAINALNGKETDGCQLTVNEARPREDRGGSRSGGGGSGQPAVVTTVDIRKDPSKPSCGEGSYFFLNRLFCALNIRKERPHA